MTSLPPRCAEFFVAAAAFFLAANAWAQPAPFAAKFDLGAHTLLYSETSGYGFEPGATESAFYFSLRVPDEGNYKVTVTLGSPDAESVTTVKAELRRLMLERVRVAAGKSETRTFIVNVRRPAIATGGEVRLKDREKTTEAWAWDDRITLEFSGNHPSVHRVAVEKAANLPTIFIAGDSTSTDQPLEPYNSWGQMLTRFFRPDIAVANHGESGESLRSFLGAGRLDKVLSVIRPGDYLLIQMGHNDQKEKGDGVGAFTTYKADLEHFVSAARAHGATPVLITSVQRLNFDAAGKIVNSLGDYPEAVRRVAREQKVALIDLNTMSQPFYEALGPRDAHLAFAPNDATHHNDYGSYELAKCVVEGIRKAVPSLAKHLVDTPPFDPAHPDPLAEFALPPDPAPVSSTKPLGQL